MSITKNIFKNVVGAAFVAVVLALVGCGGGDSNKLSGIWELERVENGPNESAPSFEFFKDGTGNMQGMSLTWKAENNRIMISTPHGQAQSLDYTLSGSTLTLYYDRDKDYKAIYNKRK